MTQTALHRAAIASIAALTAVVAIIAADFTAPASAQSDDETTGRIVARLLGDGRVEFGWQPTGGTRILPTKRYFPADVTHNRWLRSSPVEVDGAEIGKIEVRQSEDGRIEFGFTPTDGERIEPRARYFPTGARVGSWLRSTEITIGPPEDGAPEDSAPEDGAPEDSAPEDGAPEDSAPEDGAPEDSAPEDGAPEDSAPEDGAPEDSAPEDGAPEDGPPEDSAPEDDAPEDSAPEDDAPEDSAPEDDPPAATSSYTAVAAGSAHTCAIRASDGAIQCWGSNDDGRLDAPEGSFTAVSAGTDFTCAIHTGSGELECWGLGGLGLIENAPEGSFIAVSNSSDHSCAIRTDSGAIECWGIPHCQYDYDADSGSIEIECSEGGEFGELDAPDGRFTAVSAGSQFTCAIHADSGALECWGRNTIPIEGLAGVAVIETGQTNAPEGSYTAVSSRSGYSCAIRDTGAIECWGGNTNAPDGSFSTVSAGRAHTCAIRSDTGAIECWGDDDDGQATPPAD